MRLGVCFYYTYMYVSIITSHMQLLIIPLFHWVFCLVSISVCLQMPALFGFIIWQQDIVVSNAVFTIFVLLKSALFSSFPQMFQSVFVTSIGVRHRHRTRDSRHQLTHILTVYWTLTSTLLIYNIHTHIYKL